ncbi:MAG TPA: hypothetical protein PKN02_09550 [Thermotogota bacterium]|nr:hypothetical protein [Thermotogota bacterium]
MGGLTLDTLQTTLDTLKDKVIEITVHFTGMDEEAEEAKVKLEEILSLINDLALGVEALQSVLNNFPDISGLFDGVDYTGPKEEFAKVAAEIFGLFNNVKLVTEGLTNFTTTFETMEKTLREIDKVGLAETSKAWVTVFSQLEKALLPLAGLFLELDVHLKGIVVYAEASEQSFEKFSDSIKNIEPDLKKFQEQISTSEASLKSVNQYLWTSAEGMAALNKGMAESKEPFEIIIESSGAIVELKEDFCKSIEEMGKKIKEANPYLSDASEYMNWLLTPLNTIVANKLFDAMATGLGNFAKKVSDSESNLEKLRTKMKDTADNAEKLLEKLQALTAQTWTINVVYKETKS